MDQAQLIEVATQLIGVISPFIAQTSPQEGSAQANSVASDPLKPVREILQRNFAVHPKAQATLMLYEDEPNDAAMQQRMIQQIATIFQNDVSTLIELVDLAIKLQTSYLQSKQVAVSDKPQGGALMEDPELQRTPVAATGRAQTIAGESRVGVGIVGDVYGNIYYASERSKSATELLQAYYERQIARHSIISLQGFRDQMAADDALNIKLDQIYTQVTTVQSKQSITRAVATNKTLVILGEPGGGKSTVLRFLTLHLSRAGLDDQYDLRRLEGWEELSSLDEDEQYETPYALTEGAITTRMRLFPILLPLLPLSRRIAQHPDAIDYDSELWNYVAEHLETVGHQPGLANVIHDELENAERAARQLSALRAEALKKAEAELDLLTSEIARLGLSAKLVENQDSVKFQEIVDQIQEKRKLIEAKDAEVAIRRRLVVLEPRMWCVILLLDGLDEVGTDNARQDIVRAIQAFAQTYPQCRIAVTCRVRAYEGEKNAKWHLAGWPVVTLADWTLEQMQQYIKAWYLAAGTIASMSIKTREEREASLSEAIATRADLQRLGTRPLLLTIMALVHFNDARLAENRATLYRRCIDILLGQWELGKGQSEFGTITDYVKMPNADVKQLRPLLQRAAFQAQSADMPDTFNALGRDELRAMVADFLTEQKLQEPWNGAERFLTYINERAGILQPSDSGKAYVFPHQTFQEYLAGVELVSRVDFVKQVMMRRDQEQWRLPITLGINHLVSEGALAMPYQLLSKLLLTDKSSPARYQRNVIFAAELGSDVGWDALDMGGDEFRALRQNTAQALADLLEAQLLPGVERIRAGVLLGNLRDPRPGVCELPPIGVQIIGGTFLIGETIPPQTSKDEFNTAPLTLPDFTIARFLVTNAQYGQFVEAGGYDLDKPWWEEDGRKFLLREELLSAKKNQPSFWKDGRFGIGRPNHPVVGVTWFEAVAFCRWLSQQTNKTSPGIIFRLPTEAEWEYTARGTIRRPYPWGAQAPDNEYANYDGLYSGTSAVGCFGHGATPEGVQDLGGNTWEWTSSFYNPYPYYPDDRREASVSVVGKRIVVRGGSWNTQAITLRASGRNNLLPTYQSNALGFRLAWNAPAPGSHPK